MVQIKHIIDYGTINIQSLNFDTSLWDILNADRIELPTLHDSGRVQIMEALYKIKDLLDWQEMLDYIQNYLDPSDNIPKWANSHPDKIPLLLSWWEAYLDDETTYREALNLAFDKITREEFKNENRT